MTTSEAEKNVSDKTLTTVIYALYAASLVFGVTCLVAIIINYVKRDDVRGTWLESHFRWQIRTFWFSLLWGLIGLATTFIIVGFAILRGPPLVHLPHREGLDPEAISTPTVTTSA